MSECRYSQARPLPGHRRRTRRQSSVQAHRLHRTLGRMRRLYGYQPRRQHADFIVRSQLSIGGHRHAYRHRQPQGTGRQRVAAGCY